MSFFMSADYSLSTKVMEIIYLSSACCESTAV